MDKTYPDRARSEEEIREFTAACNALCETKFLLAERKIADLLRTVAAGRRLFSLFEDALAGYDRKAAFERSRTKVGNRGKLVPPQTRKQLMAYVFCLLVEIDTGKRPLREFLDEYFFHTNPSEEFALFCSALIVPFRDVTEYAFYNGLDPAGDENGETDASLRETAKSLLARLTTAASESSDPYDLKQDLYILARALESSLTPSRADLIRPLTAGLKNTIAACSSRDKTEPIFGELIRLFSTNDLI